MRHISNEEKEHMKRSSKKGINEENKEEEEKGTYACSTNINRSGNKQDVYSSSKNRENEEEEGLESCSKHIKRSGKKRINE